jgi:hypothetical protein
MTVIDPPVDAAGRATRKPKLTGFEPQEVLVARGRCGAQLKHRDDGKRCLNGAGKGTDHVGIGTCAGHLGATRSHRIKAEADTVNARVGDLLIRVGNTNPNHLEGLVEVIAATSAMRTVLQMLVSDLPAHPDKHGPGIYGPDHLGDLRMHPLVVELHRWTSEEAKQRKLAIDAGITERQLAITEKAYSELGAILRGSLEGALDAMLHLVARGAPTAEDVRDVWSTEVPRIVARQITRVTSTEIDVSSPEQPEPEESP